MDKPRSPFEYYYEFIMRETEEDQSHMEPVDRARTIMQAAEVAARCAATAYDSIAMWAPGGPHSDH